MNDNANLRRDTAELQLGLDLFEQTWNMLESDQFTVEIDDASNIADAKRRRKDGDQVIDAHYDVYSNPADPAEDPDLVMSVSFEQTTHQPDATYIRYQGAVQPPFAPPGSDRELVVKVAPFDEEIRDHYGLGVAEWAEFIIFGTGADARVAYQTAQGTFHDVTGYVPPERLVAMQQLAWERATAGTNSSEY